MRRLLLAATILVAAAPALSAQRLGPPVERPRLRDVTDTNDAQAYYDLGLAMIERDASQAADAFYWAARINPGWGEPLYARRAALLMRDRGMLRQFFERNRRRPDSPAFRSLDSLQFRALMLSPFLYRRLDQSMFMAYIRENIARRSRMSGEQEPSTVEMNYYIEQYLTSGGPWMRGWLAYGRGEFTAALRHFANARGDVRETSAVRLERARLFGMLGQSDSAVAEMRLALVELRKQDQKDLVVLYDSKAAAEFSIGVLLEGTGDVAGAREAYGQALQEDLSFYPAHMRLGLLALGTGDTTTAVSELALAAQVAADEPLVRYTNGWVLAVARRYAEAVPELRQARELEPYFALPYLRLGQVYETMGKGPEAAEAYQAFLERASSQDLQRDYAKKRLADVKEYLALMPKP
jgi:tetratricopeptide (TPR) repeat protein